MATVTVPAGTNVIFVLNRHLSQSEFPTLTDLVIDTDATFDTVCFAAGPRIATPGGWGRLVRIAAGALGHGLPLRNLVVTADHALCL